MSTAGESGFEWPDELLEAQRFEIARNTIPLLLEVRRWVHRRVETVEFFHETRIHRNVSVDFTIPGFDLPKLVTPRGALILIPLAFLRKEPLRNFDLRDEDGRVLPALTSDQNGKIASALLIYLAEFVLSQAHSVEPLNADVRDELVKIAIGDRVEARLAHRNLRLGRGPGSHHQRTLLWQNDEVKTLATDFAQNFLLLVALEGMPGDRRVLKFAYENTIRPMNLSPVRTPLRWAGLRAVPFGTRVASLGTAASYHVEIGIPDDLLIVSASLSVAGQAEPVMEERSVARAHLYVRDMARGTSGIVQLYLRVRSPIVLQTLLASAFTSAVLGSGLVLHGIGVHPSPDALTALVVVLPGVFAALLARPGEHPVVLRLVTGLRVGILVSAFVSFVAAGTLAVSLPGPERLAAWRILLAASSLVTFTAAVAYIQAVWRERLQIALERAIRRARVNWVRRFHR